VKRQEERSKKGFFTFEDGTKSTDPENKNRVKKDKKTELPSEEDDNPV
jgi:hypothetical protein